MPPRPPAVRWRGPALDDEGDRHEVLAGEQGEEADDVVWIALVHLHPGERRRDAEQAGGMTPPQAVLAGLEGEGGRGQGEVAHDQRTCLTRADPENVRRAVPAGDLARLRPTRETILHRFGGVERPEAPRSGDGRWLRHDGRCRPSHTMTNQC